MNVNVLSLTLNPHTKVKPYPATNVAKQWEGDQKKLDWALVIYFIS